MEDGVSTVCVERAAIGERDGKLLEPVDEMIGVRNAAYGVGRHGKAGLHGGGLAILRLGKDAKIKRRGGYTTKAMTATTHDFLPSDTLSQAQVSAKLSPREVQA